MRNVIFDYYFWLCKLVHADDNPGHEKLLEYLMNREFVWYIENDDDREKDGLRLRDKFMNSYNCPEGYLRFEDYSMPCTMLEMMAALAWRIEDDVMYTMGKGDRTGVWFWTMIQNLGLYSMTNSEFDEAYCESSIRRLLDRTYDRHGNGSMFPLPHCPKNLSKIDIWTQAMWYFNEIN